jgi:hypothetical protein
VISQASPDAPADRDVALLARVGLQPEHHERVWSQLVALGLDPSTTLQAWVDAVVALIHPGRRFDAVTSSVVFCACFSSDVVSAHFLCRPEELASLATSPLVAVPQENPVDMPEHPLEPTFFTAALRRAFSR